MTRPPQIEPLPPEGAGAALRESTRSAAPRGGATRRMTMAATQQQCRRSNACYAERRGFGDRCYSVKTRDGCRRGYGRCEGGALDADVAVDDGVVVDVHLAVVVEVAVEPAGRSQTDVAVDPGVVVDVQLAVEVRVP